MWFFYFIDVGQLNIYRSREMNASQQVGGIDSENLIHEIGAGAIGSVKTRVDWGGRQYTWLDLCGWGAIGGAAISKLTRSAASSIDGLAAQVMLAISWLLWAALLATGTNWRAVLMVMMLSCSDITPISGDWRESRWSWTSPAVAILPQHLGNSRPGPEELRTAPMAGSDHAGGS